MWSNRLRILAFCVAAGTAASPASAQGLLDVLGHIFGGGAPAPSSEPDVLPPPGAKRPDSVVPYFPRGDEQPAIRSSSAAESGGRTSYCVRICDGRYFPIPSTAGTAPAKICAALCPTARTEIYSGSSIETAHSAKGEKYASLPNAFAYRDGMVEGCSCNAKSETGTTQISYLNDPTLRAGDIVMTENGAIVFKGEVGPTHKESDFVPVQKSNRISGTIRDKVMAMKVMPTRHARPLIEARKNEPVATAEAVAGIKAPEYGIYGTRALGFAD